MTDSSTPGVDAQDSIGDGRLLLGMPGWEHASWEGRYYPEDLPADWRLNYYANDLDCVLLDDAALQALDPEALAEAVADLPDGFRFYVRQSGAGAGPDPHRLALLGGHLRASLCAAPRPADQACWRPGGRDPADGWCDAAGEARLVLWDLSGLDLRALRARLLGLPATVEAVIVQGDDLDPGRLRELRTLAELLGLA